MLTANFKLKVRKFFSQVWGFKYVAAVSTIQLKFPNFDPNNDIHWYNLVDKCEEELLRREQESRPKLVSKKAQLDLVTHNWGERGIYVTSTDSFLGYSRTYSKAGVNMGSLGYSSTQDSWFYQFGRNGRRVYHESLSDAACGFLWINRYNVFAA